jgi:anthranilate synthase component I
VSTNPLLIRPLALRAADLRRLAYRDPVAYPVLLDSAAQGQLSRYSILAAYPEAALWQDGQGRLRGRGLGEDPGVGEGFLATFERLWRQSAIDRADATGEAAAAAGPFRGGWVLYLGYEIAGEIEPQLALPEQLTSDAAPRAFALRVPAAIVHDHLAGRSWSVVEAGHAELVLRIERDLAAIAIPIAGDGELPPVSATAALMALPLQEEDPQRFGSSVGAALEHIRSGDIYQANLSRGWRAPWVSTRPDGTVSEGALGAASAQLYERLRTQNPAPFAALARFDGWHLLSSSPERLVRVEGQRVETRPIAGTRPRSRTAAADPRELAALIAHPKERAEHIMLVDLERNDLGRVCRAGTVRADELMITESYAHVHHIVSNVCGELIAGLSPVDVLRAVFPGGSITGCPKFRCMQIIAELEREARGAYTGALGYVNRDGSMDLNILIRTITMDSRALEFRAGAGIVADSDWQLELQETRAKARGMIAALQNG